jgi:hypothetical protein
MAKCWDPLGRGLEVVTKTGWNLKSSGIASSRRRVSSSKVLSRCHQNTFSLNAVYILSLVKRLIWGTGKCVVFLVAVFGGT